MNKSDLVVKIAEKMDISLMKAEEILSALGDGYSEIPMKSYISQLEYNVKKTLNGFIGKTVVYLLNDELYSNGVFVSPEDISYNLIVNSVKERVERSLQDFVTIHIQDEAQKIINKIRMEN